MGSVLKSNRYRLIDNRSFDLPLPIKYEVLKEDSPVAEYEVSAEEKVSCRILTKHKEEVLTPIYRSLDIADVYYFFSSRVFQDRTPFTYSELALLGLEKYNVYDIIRKTRGVTPYDHYWVKFDGDDCDYDRAVEEFNTTMSRELPGMSVAASPVSAPIARESEADVSEILNQHKCDVAAKIAENEKTAKPAEPVQPSKHEEHANNTMSADEIEALLVKSGLAEPEPISAPSESAGGTMSQEDIEKMLASMNSSEPEPVSEPTPATETAEPSGGKMSQEDIEKMLASMNSPEPEPAPEPTPATETAEPSGGKMSQEDIEKMLASMNSPEPETVPEPAPAPETAEPSGGKMSQEEIEALLGGMKNDVSQ